MAETQAENSIMKSCVTVGQMMMLNDRNFPYGTKISSSYTGAIRILKARTMWELESLIKSETNRFRAEEIRKHALEIAGGDERVAAEEMTKQLREARKGFEEIIAHTLSIDDKLDWERQMITSEFGKFSFAPPPVREIVPEKTGLLKIIDNGSEQARADAEYKKKLSQYSARKKDALRNYMAEKEKFNSHKRSNNAEIRYLKNSFEKGERSAVEKYANIILANSIYPPELKMDHEIYYNRHTKTMTVRFLFQGFDSFPIIDEYKYSHTAQCIKEKRMEPVVAEAFYEKVLLSVALRTIHELYEAIYVDFIDKIIFNGFVLNNGTVDENMSADIISGGKARCVFGILVRRKDFNVKEISDEKVIEILNQLGLMRVKGRFSDISEIIKPLEEEE